MINVLAEMKRRFYKWTHQDPDFQAAIERAIENRKQQDERLQTIAKAALDSEDTWILNYIKANPECSLKIITKCQDPPKDS